MSYDATKDKHADLLAGHDTYGTKARYSPVGDTGDLASDDTDLDPYAKAIVVTAAGNLVILPAENADGDTVTFTSAPVGLIPPYRVRRVLATGTTADWATIDDDN